MPPIERTLPEKGNSGLHYQIPGYHSVKVLLQLERMFRKLLNVIFKNWQDAVAGKIFSLHYPSTQQKSAIFVAKESYSGLEFEASECNHTITRLKSL